MTATFGSPATLVQSGPFTSGTSYASPNRCVYLLIISAFAVATMTTKPTAVQQTHNDSDPDSTTPQRYSGRIFAFMKLKGVRELPPPGVQHCETTRDERLKVITLRDEAVWDTISEERLEELIRSMPARLQAVIDADGYPTPY